MNPQLRTSWPTVPPRSNPLPEATEGVQRAVRLWLGYRGILTRRTRWRTHAAVWLALAAAAVSHGQEVSGIYAEPATKDLGELTGNASLKGLKLRGWAEIYYAWNANDPDRATVNANQPLSVVKSRDLTIEGRTFDVHSDSVRLHHAEIEIEKVPERGGLGFKLDLAGGDTQNIIFETIRAASPDSVRGLDRIIQHASVSYLAPIGRGLRVDVGKFVTHIGGETIESIKNRHFSRAFFYTYGIPVQDAGVRLNYSFTDKTYGELYILKGWNVTFDNNDAPSIGASVGWTASSKVTVYANYLGGPERNDNSHDRRDLIDLQIVYGITENLQSMLNIDLGRDENALSSGEDATWTGISLHLRANVADRFFPSLRAEYYDDPDGFTTGVAQTVGSLTFTGDCRLTSKDSFLRVLLRPEVRYDVSNAPFFTRENRFRSRKKQFTADLALVGHF